MCVRECARACVVYVRATLIVITASCADTLAAEGRPKWTSTLSAVWASGGGDNDLRPAVMASLIVSQTRPVPDNDKSRPFPSWPDRQFFIYIFFSAELQDDRPFARLDPALGILLCDFK